MRKVVVYELLSLDGVAEDPGDFFGWDEVLDANLADVISTQDVVILGRGSYEEWAPYWPGSDLEPFASFINGVDKLVATSRPLDKGWAGATVIDGDLLDAVRRLREGKGGDIGVHASISIAQALFAADLVDELRVVIAPTVVGRGRRLLDAAPALRLETLRSEVSPTGHLVAQYRVVRSGRG